MLLVRFDLAVYIIGALLIWKFIIMGEDHPPSVIITFESTSTSGLRRPEGWGNWVTCMEIVDARFIPADFLAVLVWGSRGGAHRLGNGG